jgi:hypothetical protein
MLEHAGGFEPEPPKKIKMSQTIVAGEGFRLWTGREFIARRF